jgi:glycosyltransferase involved in cell wall biosynthesis
MYNKSILIISPERWGTLKVSKHHYASVLAKMGNKVFFLNPPRISDETSVDIKDVENNLKTIDYMPFIRGSNRLPMILRKRFHKNLANKIIDSINVSIDITWSFDPSSFQYMSAFGAQLNIFHPVDVHRNRFEIAIARNADLIIATSDNILERYKGVNKPKLKVNHGIADYFLETKRLSKSFIKSPNKVNVGLIGNLHYSFLDCETLIHIIKNNYGVDFYFIGPTGKSNLSNSLRNEQFVRYLKLAPNAFLLGSILSEDLPSYLREFDLFLICYTGDKNIAEMANPHKILEYLSTGKPVVSHYIDEYRDHRDIICMADDNKSLPELFFYVIHNLSKYNLSELIEKRKNLAENNTYSFQIIRIEKFLSNLYNEKVL